MYISGNTLKFERLKISSEIKGNFKLDGNVLEIALQLSKSICCTYMGLNWLQNSCLSFKKLIASWAFFDTPSSSGGLTGVVIIGEIVSVDSFSVFG